MQRQGEGTGAAEDLYHPAGQQGQANRGGQKHLGRRARGRRQHRAPGRGHDAKDRPALIAGVSRQGAVVLQATRDCTVKTRPKAADLAVPAGSRRYTDSASSSRALQGSVHACVNHPQNAYARGDGHEQRAEWLFALRKPYLRVLRGVRKGNLPGDVGGLQCLRNFRPHNACEQAERIWRAALEPTMARRAKPGEFVTCLDHFALLHTARN